MVESGPVGRRVRIRMDTVDTVKGGRHSLHGTITQTGKLQSGGVVLSVRLDGSAANRLGTDIRDILVAGIGMDLGSELFSAAPRRPLGIPILVAVWRLVDAAQFQQVVSHGEHPPAREFLGRAEILLEAG